MNLSDLFSEELRDVPVSTEGRCYLIWREILNLSKLWYQQSVNVYHPFHKAAHSNRILLIVMC